MNHFLMGIFMSASLCLTLFSATVKATGNQLTGTLSIKYTDYEDEGRSELRHEVILEDGTVVPFTPMGNSQALKNGEQAVLPASVLKNPNVNVEQITFITTGSDAELNATASSIDANGVEPSSVNSNRSVLVMLVKFENSLAEYATITEANDIVFNQANDFYLESSKGKVGLTGDTIGYLTVPLDKFVCDTWMIGDEADVLARQQGFEPNNYDHVMYVITANLGCGWSGEATYGGTPSRSWIKSFDIATVVHELGHNLGLAHSRSKDCETDVNSGTCTIINYGDLFDSMGGGNHPSHYNAFQKERLGWLANQITTVTSDQIITLDYYESTTSSSTTAVKIYLGNDTQGNARYYYLEYRTPVGFDKSLFESYPNLADSVILREGTENSMDSSFLLDTTPMSTSSGDWSDSMIAVGQRYLDQDTGVSIDLLSADGSQATVSISFGDAVSCNVKSPSFSAPSAIEMSAWQQKSLSYTLKNNDSTDCPAKNIVLSEVLPTGWDGQWQQTAVTLAPQQSTTVYFDLYVDDTIGEQKISFTASSGNNEANAELMQTITVKATSSNTAPIAVADSLALASKSSATIAVLTNDSDAEGDVITVLSAGGASKGSVTVNQDNTITYTPAKSFKSRDSFTYTISDGELSATTTVEVTLVSNPDDDGGNGGGNGGGKGNNKKP